MGSGGARGSRDEGAPGCPERIVGPEERALGVAGLPPVAGEATSQAGLLLVDRRASIVGRRREDGERFVGRGAASVQFARRR